MRRLFNRSENSRRFFEEKPMDEQGETVRKILHPQAHHTGASQANQMTLVLWGIVVVITLVLVGAFGVYFLKPEWWPWGGDTTVSGPLSEVTDQEGPKLQGKPSGYVAVFLTNNQVYFGKISSLSNQYPTLRDVFYLRAQRSLVPPNDEETSPGAKLRVERQRTGAAAQNERLTLLKLGSELHGPVDEIKLNREHILYIEEIRDDSKVYQAIFKYKAKQE